MVFSWLDTVLILAWLTQILEGSRKGLVRGSLELLALAGGTGAFLLAPSLGKGRPGIVLAIAILLLIPVRLAFDFLLRRTARGPRSLWLHRLNQGFGVLPGAAWGGVVALVIVALWLPLLGHPKLPSPLADRVWGVGKPLVKGIVERARAYPQLKLLPEGWAVAHRAR